MGRSTLLLVAVFFLAAGCSLSSHGSPPPKPQVLYLEQPDDTWQQADPLPRDTPKDCFAPVPPVPTAPTPEDPNAP